MALPVALIVRRGHHGLPQRSPSAPTGADEFIGAMPLGYDTVVPGGRPPEGHNLMLSAGLLPGMELTGRLAVR